jgi:diacylglycerol O-acyltransferase / wax synthase
MSLRKLAGAGVTMWHAAPCWPEVYDDGGQDRPLVTATFHERLSGQDLSFLAIEDGRAHMHVGVVSLFEAGPLRLADGGIDFERIESLVSSHLHRVPRLRQKLAWVRGFGQPVWIDDPDFNLHYHLRHTALPPPGDIRQLKRLVGRIMSQELDRGKPLWEHWFVDGVEGDRFALISKVHHCLADGIAGLAIIGTLVDPDPDLQPAPPEPWSPRPAPTDAALVVEEIRYRSALPVEFIGAQLRRARSISPGSIPSWAALRQLAETSLVGTPTPLNVPIGPHRRFDWIELPFDEVHDVAVVAGGTINDVALALTSSALRAFLGGRGTDVDTLEMSAMVPVNTRGRTTTSTMGNSVSDLIVPLPTAEADPWTRLERVVEVTRRMKASNQPSIVDEMSHLIELVPRPLLGPVLRRGSQSTAANLAVSNIPGPRVPLYLLGARQLEMYPVLPLIGNQTLGIAMMSHEHGLGWGIIADWDALPDLHDLVEFVGASHEELTKLARKRAKRRSRSKTG